MASWDDEDGEDHKFVVPTTNEWDGEDEDDVKDAWDDEEEEEEKDTESKVEKPKKKSLKEKIAEKEAQKKKEREERLKKEEEANKVLSAAEISEEKMRIQKLQEDSDLLLMQEAMGTLSPSSAAEGGLEAMNPTNREEFAKFAKALKTCILKHEKSIHYTPFLEELFRDISAGLSSDDARKLGSALNAIANEKAKAEKGKNKKKKGVKLARDTNLEAEAEADYGDDFDDFI